MAWNESRSRDEWLAEVKRRGGRIRRRRQFTVTLVGALALVLPATAVATLLGADAARDVRQLVAGPAPDGEVLPAPGRSDTTVVEPAPGPVEEPATTTTTVEPQGRVGAVAGPLSTPGDDPVVRAATTTIAPASTSSAARTTPSSTTVPPAAGPPPPACVAADFKLTVSVENKLYGPGETVKASSRLEKRSDGSCLLNEWGLSLKIADPAGKDVTEATRSRGEGSGVEGTPPCESGSCGIPRFGPGVALTAYVQWQNCAIPWPIVPKDDACFPFPAGTYTVTAEWSGPGGGPPARATFDLTK